MATFGGEDVRIGIGYDVHKLVEGRKLVIGGVNIPFSKGLLGHSDADVLVHAINDALLGAMAMGDIGKHFPDTDDKYKDISSIKLMEEVNKLLKNGSYSVANIDSVICAEKPKLSSYIQDMREIIAKTLDISIDQVSIKATTVEGLGVIGNGEGISAKAVCLIE